ncbi:hypothetical protein LK09_17150 [Microbacterium mangrovi]|uniref:Peptidoglycan binding-like domain-containing protein n=1 Tax=Microbacterium mangrovi TaxID=1348253 RepID=A0A0B2A2Q7_9MICO|nr:hypothetical protein LK09_17150 [Microbacterium mangrovi]
MVAGSWALVTVLRPVSDPSTVAKYTYARVTAGKVGQTLNLDVVARWTSTLAGSNRAAGVVTSVDIKPGQLIASGQVLYSVDLRPVVAARGSVPTFRAIGPHTSGRDVSQLQRMLTATRFYAGPIDGTAGAGTVAAIKAWQKSRGEDATGTVERGDVIFLPSLPARVTLDTKVVSRGASLAGGEPVLQELPAAPRFTLALTTAQAALLTSGTRVDVTAPGGAVWHGVSGEQVSDQQTEIVTVSVDGPKGAVLCGRDCDRIPPEGETRLSSSVLVVPTVWGLVVPSSALVTGADGKVAVITDHGTRRPVRVRTSAEGMSVIDGVRAGERVRVPGGDAVPQ